MSDNNLKDKLSAAPDILAEIAGLIGEGPALQLAREFGGTQTCFPKLAKRGQRISEVIGIRHTQKLYDHFGSSKIDIPLGPTGTYSQFIRRQAEIIDHAISSGKTSPAAARLAGTTVRTVRRHRNRKARPGQPELF